MSCPSCDAHNPAGARFCNSCGGPLASACPNCGAPQLPTHRFCNECGTPLAATAGPPADPPDPGTPQATAELRHVSVLFVDLVGFTTLSEARDAEDVRELLGAYFERAKAIVGRYGGTIEKFIGDAVMAVWGVPVAREDDAERAVRAGLDLVDAVTAFGAASGIPDLRARAGIVTGRVASLANPGEGLVVGDRVNTAARVQAAAMPGTVFVDEVTRQATSAAIAYEDAGEHAAKGKAAPLHLFRALRAVAGVGGAQRADGLEAPLVGRDAQLRLLKDLLHTCIDRGGARIVGVSGPAGVGKSRLGWELLRYADAIADTLLWHTGRSLAYGEGVAYWALAEMVRQRLGIADEDGTAAAVDKLGAGLDRWVADPDERRRIEPALRSLLGTGEPGGAREELFAGWRLFFERLSDHHPVILLFEDTQWADEGLLDFIEHLLEWAADRPIFVCSLARSELSERRHRWPADVPGGTLLVLDPLPGPAIETLLLALVADLPRPALARIASQAEGIPLYAVETVRNLADRGMLVERDGRLAPAGEIGELDVPASLHSLLSARLDGLDPVEREVVKATAVFGGSFSRASVTALTGIAAGRLDQILAALVQRGIFAIRTDPLSPNRGQYSFSQGLLRTVAYEMIARRERRPLHLAAAEHLRSAFPNDGEEVAEVIAAHLLDAYHAAQGDPDVETLRADALGALRRAAQRAGATGAPETAERALRNAIELSRDDDERADLLQLAGLTATWAGHFEAAAELIEAAITGYGAVGRERDAARLVAPLARALRKRGRSEVAGPRLRDAMASLDGPELDPALAELQIEMAIVLQHHRQYAEAGQHLARALDVAEALEIPQLIVQILNLSGIAASHSGRYEEARVLFEGAHALSDRHRLPERGMLLSNAADVRLKRDMPDAVAACESALALARQVGRRDIECMSIGNLMIALLWHGRWREAEAIGTEALDRAAAGGYAAGDAHFALGILAGYRGAAATARDHLAAITAWEDLADYDAPSLYRALVGFTARAAGREGEALDALEGAARSALAVAGGASSDAARISWGDAVDAALASGRLDRAEGLVARLGAEPRGRVAPVLRAELDRARGRIAAVRGEHDTVEGHLRAAVAGFTELGYPFCRARAETDLAAWLTDRGRCDEAAPLRETAATALDALGAQPQLSRLQDLAAARPAAAAS